MENYYLDMVKPALREETIPMTLKPESMLCPDYVKHQCFSDDCEHAHRADDLVVPFEYRGINAKKKGGVNATFGNNSRRVVVWIDFKDCFQTSVVRAVLNRNLDTSKFVVNVCESFNRCGKCPFWWNCMFLHVKPEVVKQKLRTFTCKYKKNCNLQPACQFAHDGSEIVMPKGFEEREFKGLKSPIQVWVGNSSEMVAVDHLCFTKALTVDKPRVFCDSPDCAEWENCTKVHLKQEWWKSSLPTIFVPHPYVKNGVKAKIVEPVKARVFTSTNDENEVETD